MRRARQYQMIGRAVCSVIALAFLCGCRSSQLAAARENYYMGRLPQAEGSLLEGDIPKEQFALVMMERGLIRQTRGDYTNSAKDFNQSSAFIEEYMMMSVSRGAASMVINDNVGIFYGDPYERTLMHAINARNYLALSEPFEAAVEARLILRTLQPERKSKDYPDDAYSRYIAGLCFELIGDPSNAAIEYQHASNLCVNAAIDARTGFVYPKSTASLIKQPVETNGSMEMVCLVDYGRVKLEDFGAYDRIEGIQYAEICSNGKVLGRTYVVADIQDIAVRTERQKVLSRMMKTFTRIVLKEQISRVLDDSSPALGFLARGILFGFLEKEDVRRWETLPRFMAVARFRLNGDIKSVDVVFKGLGGRVIKTVESIPVYNSSGKRIVLCRDITERARRVKSSK